MNINQLGKLKYRHSGFTLIELMISITIGLIILAAVLSMFVTMIKSDNDNMNSIRLNQDLRATMSLIARNLRRVGTNQNSAADSITSPPTNPFQGLGVFQEGVAAVFDVEGVRVGDCVTFSYDANDTSNELYGYQLNGGIVETRTAGTACGEAWDPITDNTLVTITGLIFSDLRVTTTGINVHQITITLSGQLTNDPTVSRTLTEVIKIRNDEI